ncbi:hypothetical protein HDV02_002047 [Globomyces sp. JEL0801]|nr:hypothetical protein HDV02_002047 [Globomyces sp. JEL0801]
MFKSIRNLSGSGKISKVAKKKRVGNFKQKLKENKSIELRGDLLEWVETETLTEMLDKTNCETLKCICMENGIPRAGAKYEVRMKIIKTVQAWKTQQEKSKGKQVESIQ